MGLSPGSEVMENASQHCKSHIPTSGVSQATSLGTAPTPQKTRCVLIGKKRCLSLGSLWA